jgi:hypothetical protein
VPEIRPFLRADVPAVIALLGAHLGGERPIEEDFLVKTTLDHPWADPEVPSLVAVEDGAVVGFIAAQSRRLSFDGRQVLGVCCSHLTVHPDHRRGAAGALLIGRLLSGQQEVTWSDSADDAVLRIWRMYGGHVDHARACDWMLVLSPLRWTSGVISRVVRRQPVGRRLVPVAAIPAQAMGQRLMPRAFPPKSPNVTSEPATPASIVEHLPALTRKMKVHVDYDEPELEHVFRLIEGEDELVRRLVRWGDKPIGCYAYLSRPATASRVLALWALERHVDDVLGDLIDDARGRGAALLAGRLEPHLDDALRNRFAVAQFALRPVVHTHNSDLGAVLPTADSLITMLDGEWFIEADASARARNSGG